ncbi:MAG: sulfite exporter TauE/SafE family protein [Paracoccaceae bacterium]|nr:sulfite exporter TauE/SafE family protein [Paracoccaceae bacterium]
MSLGVDALAPILVALFLGGILKGATGAGVPVVAVPVMVLFVDLPVAISVMAVVNLATNFAQAWQYRARHEDARLSGPFAAGCGLGTLAGTIVLATAPPSALLLALALVVLVYIAFRLLSPEWVLSRAAGRRLAGPAGTLGGLLQGATGISAPVTVTFLNALGLPRAEFIAVISAAFLAMAVPQIAALWWYGFLSLDRLALGLAVTLVVFAGMPMGAYVAERVGKTVFDRVILALLAVIALRLIYGALS